MAQTTYANGRFYRDGEPLFFRGVEYQYYRDKRSNWAARLDQLQAADCNVVCFYVPWRHHIVHDPATGAISYDFEGRTLDSRDLAHFLDLCEARGLSMLVKPGPFVHSELNIGGLPDVASPSFNPEIEPVRLHDGRPLFWEYDHTQLPSPNDEVFDALARRWLGEVRAVLEPHVAPRGGIIALQLLDETIYCTSNDAPWHFGYDAPDMRHFHGVLEARYGTIEDYNRAHGTEYKAFCFVPAPVLDPSRPVATTRQGLLALVDWAEFQWRIRREFYALYKRYLGLDLPYLTNFAGITPPIVENVPDAHEAAAKDSPPDYVRLYADWWYAHNRVDQDRDVYEYGMISWLGVAAYDVSDASSAPAPDAGTAVFDRYLNTARRRRGINVEENWGFSKLYHPLSRHPLVPVFQTLASVAGGCTGYVVFCGVNHGYWLDDLDRTTQKQHRTFPDAAPIGEHGETGAMYEAMRLLNGWFAREGAAFLRAEPDVDVCLLVVPDWAAVSSWVPGPAQWALPHAVPRVGTDVYEPAVRILNRAGMHYVMAELPALTVEELLERRVCAIHLAFFLARADQEKLCAFVRQGGVLIASGELPAYDDLMQPCSVLADFARTRPAGLHYSTGNVFRDEAALLGNLRAAGRTGGVACTGDLRAVVYRDGDESFVLFFDFGRGRREASIAFDGRRLDLVVGTRTCGAVRLRGDRIVSWLVKGVNEVEGERAVVELRSGDQRIVIEGDGSGTDGA